MAGWAAARSVHGQDCGRVRVIASVVARLSQPCGVVVLEVGDRDLDLEAEGGQLGRSSLRCRKLHDRAKDDRPVIPGLRGRFQELLVLRLVDGCDPKQLGGRCVPGC